MSSYFKIQDYCFSVFFYMHEVLKSTRKRAQRVIYRRSSSLNSTADTTVGTGSFHSTDFRNVMQTNGE